MTSTLRILFLVILLPLLLGVACDPQAPGAIGQLTVSPEAKLEAGRTLEIRFVPDDGKAFDVTTADLIVEYPHRQASWNLTEIEFPFQYEIGGGLGSSEHGRWRVVAWIAESDDVDRPNPAEWYGTRVFSIGDCGVVTSKFCGVIFDIDFEIDSERELPASESTESTGLEPGEYIEKKYDHYTVRCMEGPADDARSIGRYVVRVYAAMRSQTESATKRLVTQTAGVRDGTIQDCWITDLDADGNADVLVFTKSAGSGGFANLYTYTLDGTVLQPTELPDPDPDLVDGFQGRDWYDVTGGMLIRKFPVYSEGDANCCPEGGSRVIEFDGSAGTWKLHSDDRP